jgi:hypothetical protein
MGQENVTRIRREIAKQNFDINSSPTTKIFLYRCARFGFSETGESSISATKPTS